MAALHTSGSASSFGDLRAAIVAFLTGTPGWVETAAPSDNGFTRVVLSKNSLYVKLGSYSDPDGIDPPYIFAYFGTGYAGGTTLTGESGRAAVMASPRGSQITFPITYEIFWNDTPEEIYIVINYNGNKYQHLHWGQGDLPGVLGTRLWFNGAYEMLGSDWMDTTPGHLMYMSSSKYQRGSSNIGRGYIYITNYSGISGGYFLQGDSSSWPGGGIHAGFDDMPVKWCEDRDNNNSSNATDGDLVGQWQSWPILAYLPSLFNESEVLLPIMVTLARPDGVRTYAAALRHVRMLRIDNVNPGDIITYGADQWKVFPVYAKNTVQRDGVAWATGAEHSGTLGVAIRMPGA